MNKFVVPDTSPTLESEAGARPRPQIQKFLTPLVAVIAVVSLIGNVLQKYNARLSRPIVTVGGQPVSKFEYQNALDEQAGKQVLSKLVYSDLVRQAAAKAHVMPTDKEVDARLAQLKARSPQIVPSQNPDALKRFRQDLGTDIALENLRIKDVTVSDAEVAAYYNRYRATVRRAPQAQFTLIVTGHDVDAQKATRLLQQNASATTIASQPRMSVVGVNGFNINLPTPLAQAFRKTLFAMKPGQIKTMPVGANFLTFKLKSIGLPPVPPLSQVRDEVTRQAKLQKAISPQAELAALYQANPPTFDVPRYQVFFNDIQNYNQNGGAGASGVKTASTP